MIHQTLFYLAQASSGGSATGTPASPLSGILVPFLCIGIIFYFLIIRPQSKKQKEQAAMVSSLKSGDKVVTSGGIHGILLGVKDTTVTVKIADNVKIEVDKSAVTAVEKRGDEAAAAA